jgi:hypothetical protein
MVQAYQEADVKGLGKILRAEVPFDQALEALKAKGVRVITSRDLAYARANNSTSSLSGNGSYTREGCVYGKSQAPLVVMSSPLLNQELAVQATEANRKGNYFQLQDKKRFEGYLRQAEKDAKVDPEKRKVLTLPSRTNFTISPTQNWDTARAIFKDQAEEYFNYLGKNGINQITFYTVNPSTVDNSENPLSTQMWLCRLDCGRSGLSGNGRDLDGDFRVRGVSSETSEAGRVQGKVITPSLRQILGFSRQYVPSAVKREFETGIAKLYRKQ